MPIYQFQCVGCGAAEDFMLKITERNKVIDCWKCAGAMRHVITPVAGRVYGAAYSRKHNIPDRVTADLTGIPYKELPKGLRTRLDKE